MVRCWSFDIRCAQQQVSSRRVADFPLPISTRSKAGYPLWIRFVFNSQPGNNAPIDFFGWATE